MSIRGMAIPCAVSLQRKKPSMRSKGSSIFAVLLGSLLLIVGLIVQFVVIPGMAQFPEDVDSGRSYEGELALMLNAQALAEMDLANVFIRDVPVTIDRTVKTLEVDGGKALVLDTAVLSGPAGPIQSSESTYTIDRKTMEHIDNFTDNTDVLNREGLVVGFPIGTSSEDYLGFNDDTQTTNTLAFARKEERAGVSTYVFEATSGPDVITDPALLSTFPSELPKAVVEGLVPALGLSDEAMGQLGAILPSLPDPVPLAYLFTYETTYWVEPDTGVLVDYEKMESRLVALNLGGDPVPVGEVMHLEYAQTAASVEEAAKDATDAQGQLFWLGKVMPYTLIAGGALIAVLGLLTLKRKAV